jgi:hypothetical protein
MADNKRAGQIERKKEERKYYNQKTKRENKRDRKNTVK